MTFKGEENMYDTPYFGMNFEQFGEMVSTEQELSNAKMPCSHCGKPKFWYEPWHGFICVSWLTMEGGCRGEARIFGGTDTDTE